MGELGVSTGAMLLGIMLNVMLYGVGTMQTFEYSRTCARDPRWIKGLVIFLFLVDTLNTGLNISHVYYLFITHFGDMDAINGSTWMANTEPITTAVISAVVQLFFGYRVLRVTGNKWVFGIIIGTTSAQTVGGVVCTVILMSMKGVVDLQKLKTGVIIWLSFAVLTDILIAGALVLFLNKSRTGFAITDDVISRIIRLTMQTGLLTTICAAVDLILYLVVPNDLHLLFNFILAKLYTNSLMSSLNARSRWEASTKSSQPVQPATLLGRGDAASKALSVHVTRTVDIVEQDDIELAPRRDNRHMDLNSSSNVKRFKNDRSLNSSSADDNVDEYATDHKASLTSAV